MGKKSQDEEEDNMFLSIIGHVLKLKSSNNATDGRAGRALFDSCKSGYGDQCCPLVVDTLSWLALLAGIAVATFILQQAIVANINGRRKRRRREDKRGGVCYIATVTVPFHLNFVQVSAQL